MKSVFDIKTIFMTPLIKLIIKHPKLMESKIFLKAMIVFPEKISRSYELKIQNSGIHYQEAFLQGRKMIENSPQRVLDICTGTGFAAFMALKHFPNALITGVDQSAGMIEIANGKVNPTDAFRIKFELGNAARLAYEDEVYNLVTTSNAPVYLPEAARVLKSGGNILVAFSFGGDAFVNAEKEIESLLDKNGITLLNLKSLGNGAFIFGQKRV